MECAPRRQEKQSSKCVEKAFHFALLAGWLIAVVASLLHLVNPVSKSLLFDVPVISESQSAKGKCNFGIIFFFL